jgi:Tfp pilus assembly protein PilF
MLWVNPKPGVPVRAVRFANPEQAACPILIGLTAAIASKGAAGKPMANEAEAKALLAKGLAALSAGTDGEARKLFEQAVQKDPTLEAAYQSLGQVCEKLKDETAALAAYRAWTQAGAHSPLPYNKIGEALERAKDYRGALEAYTRSLEIEWNQPPAIEAKSRLQKMAGS